MDPKANTRNVETLRNVLQEELVVEYAQRFLEHQVPEVLYELLEGNTQYHRVAARLQVVMPRGPRLVGLVVRRGLEASRSAIAGS